MYTLIFMKDFMKNSLQEIMDFAFEHNYKIDVSPKRKHAKFRHPITKEVMETKLYVEADTVWVWFNTDCMSGNDPVDEFVYTFEHFHTGF